MDSTSSASFVPTYPSTFEDRLGEPMQGPDMRSDSKASFTQPVARRPIDPQCADADDVDGAIAAFGQQPGERAPRFNSDRDLGSPRPL